jgi:hypothetical protein
MQKHVRTIAMTWLAMMLFLNLGGSLPRSAHANTLGNAVVAAPCGEAEFIAALKRSAEQRRRDHHLCLRQRQHSVHHFQEHQQQCGHRRRGRHHPGRAAGNPLLYGSGGRLIDPAPDRAH